MVFWKLDLLFATPLLPQETPEIPAFVERFLGPTAATLWPILETVLKVVLILILASIVLSILSRVISRWMQSTEELPVLDPRRQRASTLGNLLLSAGQYVVWPIAIIMALGELGFDIAALIATAGIAGLAIGFGAQTLVKDVISGIFLLFDDIIHVGDLIRIGGDTGTVEDVGLRLIKVRKFDGELVMVPAGEIRIFGNKSIEFARVIVNVGLSYEQDIATIVPVLERVSKEWAEGKEDILLDDEPQVQAITDFADSAVTARVIVRVRPGEQFVAERDLRQMIKAAFDELGVVIPFPQRTVHMYEAGEQPKHTITDLHATAEAAEEESEGAD